MILTQYKTLNDMRAEAVSVGGNALGVAFDELCSKHKIPVDERIARRVRWIGDVRLAKLKALGFVKASPIPYFNHGLDWILEELKIETPAEARKALHAGVISIKGTRGIGKATMEKLLAWVGLPPGWRPNRPVICCPHCGRTFVK